ncbi:MAG: hypothetical protein PUE80_03220 [bacterium]|nr:hypothetical protein [bacterium]
MMIHIANPIYDSVFKYLMEDERIAKIILSALLKKEVVDVQVRRNEYTNCTRDQVSMFRIDFGAQIRNEDGSLQLILIELQKTWLETETLRFRQYLGAHYANPENILQENNPEGYAIPMVTVYLLGHRVGDIEEPVLYVNHKAFNYQGDEVSKGLPNPFVDSLVHDSIIVQIPLLHGQINNKLEKVLSIFDQHRKAGFNRQVLTLEEDIYSDDSDMVYVLRRLLAAASDTKLRHDMNVEDEFFSAIENRDTAIMARDKRIQEQDFLISEQSNTITEQSNTITEQSNTITEQSNTITEQSNTITEQSNTITEQSNTITEQSNTITEQSNTITEQSNTITEQSDLLKKMAKSMLSNGIAIEDIASATGKSVDAIRQMLSD